MGTARLDREIWADRIVHAVGVACGVVGGIALVARAAGSPGAVVPVAVYVCGLMAMLACSALYHLHKHGRRRDWLQVSTMPRYSS
jgi:channel protein (hemolysin III family)